MESNEIKINVPEGYEIDKENSTFECVKFKKKAPERWIDTDPIVCGYMIDRDSDIAYITDFHFSRSDNKNIFAIKKQAESALAMAQLSQIIANDERFGGPITDEEWEKPGVKYSITRNNGRIEGDLNYGGYIFLAFHTEEQRDLFLEENGELIEQYYMI